MGHDHDHSSKDDLKLAIMLSSSILVLEVIGGILTNSLALLSDAAHVFSDVFALSLSWFAIKLSERPASTSRTFGFHRSEVLAALANGVLLIVISLFIFKEAYERITMPAEIKGTEMLIVAVIGLLVNLFVVFKLRGHASHDINVKSAFYHAMGDMIASVGVVIGATIIIFTGETRVDPLISAFIGIIILLGSLRIIFESQHILMEGTPRGLDIEEVKKAIKDLAGVYDIHDLHIWTICTHMTAASAHILLDDMTLAHVEEISEDVKTKLAEYGVNHATIQCECYGPDGTCEVDDDQH